MLANRKRIHLFAAVWLSRFKRHSCQPSNFFLDDFEHWFGEECRLLGFEMDCSKRYGQRIAEERLKSDNNATDLELIPNIYNWETLGSGLFSEWRYLTHWEMGPLEKVMPEYLPWFILMLEQLYKSSAPKKES
ncbi:hypothetical protein [Megasphaera sp.]|uniref:hypothetical protein n=1 Tax=Megasphaera sp. TaxID=2023260 RepID=UPI003FEF2BB7